MLSQKAKHLVKAREVLRGVYPLAQRKAQHDSLKLVSLKVV